MRTKSSVLALVCLAATSPAAPVPTAKGARVELVWKFATGDEFYVRQVEEAETQAGNGPATVRSAVVWRVRVLDARAGETKLGVEVVSLAAGEMVPGRPLVMQDEPAVAGGKFTVHLDDTHEITKVEGLGRVAKAVAAPVAKGLVGEVPVRAALSEVFRPRTTAPQAVGGEWAVRADRPIAEGVVAKTELRAKLAAVKDGLATLTAEEDVTADHESDPAELRRMRVPLASVRLSGSKNPVRVTFDVTAGRLVSQEATRETTVRLDVGNGGNPKTFRHRVTTTTTVSAEKPKSE